MTTERITPGSIADSHGTDSFGVDNMPYGSFDPGDGARLGARIGESVLDLATAVGLGTGASEALRNALKTSTLDGLLAADPVVWAELRAILTGLLESPDAAANLRGLLHPISNVRMRMPFTVSDYVDFYASEHHASNIGKILRPGQPALGANWKHLPIGYHGRAGTIVPSGTAISRPKGLRPEPSGTPSFGPTRRLDIEAELGFVLGSTAPVGEVKLGDARQHIFGVTLVNDWSARDIQGFEYVPLGPFLGKSFATSIGHWVVPLAALDAARIHPPTRDVVIADYLDDSALEPWGFDIEMVVELDGEVVSRPPVATLYWTAAQMLAHMTVNGATVRAGDFFASGTVSGAETNQRGSFMELSWGTETPLTLTDGSAMSFLRNGDTVRISATAPGTGGGTISLGEVVGRIDPAREF